MVCSVKKLLTGEGIEIILVNLIESPVKRPKRGQKCWYSRKKRRHTIKAKIVISAKTKIDIVVLSIAAVHMISKCGRSQ